MVDVTITLLPSILSLRIPHIIPVCSSFNPPQTGAVGEHALRKVSLFRVEAQGRAGTESPEGLPEAVDKAMYEVKRQGKNYIPGP